MTSFKMKTFVYLLLFFGLSHLATAQVLSAKVGVNGLTCSQCSRSVEMQLLKLPFVKEVKMNLEQTEGSLQFKQGANIDFSKIAKAVKDAGFSVRFLEARIDMDMAVAKKENSFMIGGNLFMIQNRKQDIIEGNMYFQFLGKKFSSGQHSSVSDKKYNDTKQHSYWVNIIRKEEKG